MKDLKDKQVKYDPAYTCGPPGVPRIGPPQRIIQTEREVVILYDDLSGNFWRVIPTDGRPASNISVAEPRRFHRSPRHRPVAAW